MAGQISLNDLIEALAGAVIDAQDRIERHQIANLKGYFDKDNRPVSVVLRLPSIHPDAGPDDEDYYRAALLPLVSTNLLRIKDVEISFDVDLGDLAEAPMKQAPPAGSASALDAVSAETPGARKNIHVDTGMGRGPVKGGNVHVVLRVEGSEPTEGAARLINHLAQIQGVFKTVHID